MPEARGRLLLVEDEPSIRDTFTRYLRSEGWDVRAAASGEEALGLPDLRDYRVVLLDHVLPGITGMSVLQKLPSLTGAPVVLMTGHCDEEFRRDAQLLGAKAVVAKPVAFEDLSKALDEALA